MADFCTISPRSDREILIAAGRAMGRIDSQGIRGITSISTADIEAMALALLILGLVAIPPLQLEPPKQLVHPRLKEF